MDKFSLMVPNFIPSKEYVDPKHNNACIGCGVSLAVRHVGKAVEDLLSKATFERAAGDMFGVKTDAGFMRIKQGKSELIICLDDEPGASLNDVVSKKLADVAVAEGFEYVATASPSYPFDLFEKVQSALEVEGKSFIHILCPCPTAWQFSTEDAVKMGFRAVESLAFPLYEVASGYYNLTIKTLKPRALSEYISGQGRFEKVTEKQLASAAEKVEKAYAKLTEKIDGQMAYTFETTGPVY